jgi:hypothetical protein
MSALKAPGAGAQFAGIAEQTWPVSAGAVLGPYPSESLALGAAQAWCAKRGIGDFTTGVLDWEAAEAGLDRAMRAHCAAVVVP